MLRAKDEVELLDDLLDVSRLRRDKVDLRKESLTLQAIVTEALETTLGVADARGIGCRCGVGLTLARLLVESHGGSINAHSEGPGRGSELVVRLPVGTPAG